MYYSKNIFLGKAQRTNKIYLYNRGDECVSVTGGWVVTTGFITKDIDKLTFNHQPLGTRKIATLNNIEINKDDRLFILIQSATSPIGSYFFYLGFRGTPEPSAFKTYYADRNPINQNTSIREISYFELNNYNLPIAMGNYFGIWYVYEIWIEKYEN